MCGITGIISLKARPIENAGQRIERMTLMLKHRGPDSQGVYVSNDNLVCLGNTRLAIVDPENLVKQPMEGAFGRAILSFNGEIYNYLELKNELEGRGISFKTRMDTEVLLEGLQLYGAEMLDRLDGMWAFAYYDVSNRNLLLSRDIMGERHIFYRIDKSKEELIFASEVKPILVDAGKPFDIDIESLAASIRFSSAPPGCTLVHGIKRLLPGHNMNVRIGRDLKCYRYQRLHPEKYMDFFKSSPSVEDTTALFEKIFHRACKRRLPLDVPFVSTLSGGLDSTLISVFSSEFGKKKIKTLYGESRFKSEKFLDHELDEYEASKFTSNKFNTDHIHTHLNKDECIPVLERLAENGYDGTLDQAVASFEMLALRVREEKLKVILISDGPDELLGGYKVDQKAFFIDKIFRKNPASYHMLKFACSIRGVPTIMHKLKLNKYITSPLISNDPFRFIPVHESIGTVALERIFPKRFVLSTLESFGMLDETYKDILPHLDSTQKRALSYASTSLPDHFNLRTDKAFLGASVECRLPYQAPEMAEFMIAMPEEMRFKDGTTTKYLMRKIVKDRVGPEIADRAKHGFSSYLFNRKEVYKAMKFEEVIRSSRIFKDLPFKNGAVETILKRHRKFIWPFFVLAKTYDRLKQGQYD